MCFACGCVDKNMHIHVKMCIFFLQKFCMVEKIDFEDEDSKSAVVTFQSRDEAEKVIYISVNCTSTWSFFQIFKIRHIYNMCICIFFRL